ncbi:MAG: transcriptional repressor [Bilophila wadsworthia]
MRPGLQGEVSFGGGVVRYEQASDWHTIISSASAAASIEVVDPKIEALQERLVRQYGFTPTQHRLYLYGVCPECLAGQSPSK